MKRKTLNFLQKKIVLYCIAAAAVCRHISTGVNSLSMFGLLDQMSRSDSLLIQPTFLPVVDLRSLAVSSATVRTSWLGDVCKLRKKPANLARISTLAEVTPEAMDILLVAPEVTKEKPHSCKEICLPEYVPGETPGMGLFIHL